MKKVSSRRDLTGLTVTPYGLVGQWAGEARRLYPGIKVLAMAPEDFGKQRRGTVLSRIAQALERIATIERELVRLEAWDSQPTYDAAVSELSAINAAFAAAEEQAGAEQGQEAPTAEGVAASTHEAPAEDGTLAEVLLALAQAACASAGWDEWQATFPPAPASLAWMAAEVERLAAPCPPCPGLVAAEELDRAGAPGSSKACVLFGDALTQRRMPRTEANRLVNGDAAVQQLPLFWGTAHRRNIAPGAPARLAPLALIGKGRSMACRRIPPELRRRSWTEGSAWELLVVAELLPYRFVSPLAELGMTPCQRRELRREEALLKGTPIAYILPQPAMPRRPSQPWLYVRMQRGRHYRLGDAGEIERFGRRVQHLGAGSITEHRWYPCSLRGVRWLQIVATGRMVRKLQADQLSDVQPSLDAQALGVSDGAPGSPSDTVQLPLLWLPHDGPEVGG